MEKTGKISEQIIMRRLILCELQINRESDRGRKRKRLRERSSEKKGMQNQNKKINNK